jgi:hypothetical protein
MDGTPLVCEGDRGQGAGEGLGGRPTRADGPRGNVPRGVMEVALGSMLSREFPEVAGAPLVVYTAQEEDWVVANTLCERRKACEHKGPDPCSCGSPLPTIGVGHRHSDLLSFLWSDGKLIQRCHQP